MSTGQASNLLTNTFLDNYSQGVNKMIEKVQEMEQELVSMEENANLKVYYWQFRDLSQSMSLDCSLFNEETVVDSINNYKFLKFKKGTSNLEPIKLVC